MRSGARAVLGLERRRRAVAQRAAAAIVRERVDVCVERAVCIARRRAIWTRHLGGLDRGAVDRTRSVRSVARQIARYHALFPSRATLETSEVAPRFLEQPRDLALRVRACTHDDGIDQPRGRELVDVAIDASVGCDARGCLGGKDVRAEQREADGARGDSHDPPTTTRARDTSDACRRSHYGARPLAGSRAIAWLARWSRSSMELR